GWLSPKPLCYMVPKRGLEPPLPKREPGPEPGASASSATSASPHERVFAACGLYLSTTFRVVKASGKRGGDRSPLRYGFGSTAAVSPRPLPRCFARNSSALA